MYYLSLPIQNIPDPPSQNYLGAPLFIGYDIVGSLNWEVNGMKIGNELYFQLIIVFTRFISTFRDLSKCDFSEINEHYKKLSEERKNRSKEEKKAEKEKNEKIIEDMGFCVIDGHREKIGNFRYDFP